MSYTLSAVAGIAVVVVLDMWVLRTCLVRRRGFWVAYVIVLAFQLLVNGVLTGVHVVRYDSDAITGLRIAYAPVEDLLFGFAMILATSSVWVSLTGGGRRRSPHPVADGRATGR